MKKSELAFNLSSIPLDAVMLLCAAIVSFFLRLKTESYIGPVIFQLNLTDFMAVAIKLVPFILLLFALLGLYNLKGTRGFSHEFGRVIVGISLGLLLIIVMFFFDRTVFPSRFIILSTWGIGILFVVLGRGFLKLFQRALFKSNIGLHRIVKIISSNAEKNASHPKLSRADGYYISKSLVYGPLIISDLENLYAQNSIDGIFVCDPNLPDTANLQLVGFARNKGLEYSFVPNLFEVQRNAIEIISLQGQPIISLKNTPLDGWGKVVKRVLDIFVSLLCVILTFPFFVVIAIAIKLDSRGKILYVAKRGGKDRDFNFYKFRSMFNHLSVGHLYGGKQAEEMRNQLWQKNDRGGKDGPFLKIKHDPRVTRAGRILRKTKLDEIPQFWNVLIGDMSMVGPRAHVLDEVDKYRNRYRRMFSIKPGIFGPSQIAQINSPDLPFEEEIRLNTYYIENWSVWLDVKILAKSFWLLVFGKKTNQDY